jgi:hypothetical protein
VKHLIIRRPLKISGKNKKVLPREKKMAIDNKRHKSPTRLERRVIILAPKDF